METLIMIGLSVITIMLLRIMLLSLPRFYFTIQDIVTVNSAEVNFIGFFLRFGLLFVLSLIISFIYDGDISKTIEYSLTVSFLLIWPFILDNLIFRKTVRERINITKKSGSYTKKYLIVYLMYSVMCVIFSIIAIPVYRLLTRKPAYLYKIFLARYLELDPFLQSLITNATAVIILAFLGLTIKVVYKRYVRKNFN